MEIEPKEKLPANPGVIFMGTPDFSVPCLRALVERGYNILSVVTQPDRPKGRGRKVIFSPIKLAAMEYRLNVLQPEKASDRQFLEVIHGLSPDMLIVVAFGQILTKDLLESCRWGAVNIHASLLPKYRGAAPIQWAILNNEAKTGLTAMRMDEGLDTGPALCREELNIGPEETAGELHDRLAILAGNFLIETLKGLAENRIREKPQDNSLATYAPKIDRSMSLIKWDQPARAISAHIRALDPWPGAFTTLGEMKIKLFLSRVTDEIRTDVVPGRISGHLQGALEVETARGVIGVREMQISGKKRLAANDFLRGFPLRTGTVFGR